jgi:hypothetical protein
MSAPEIHIDCIELSLRGVCPAAARNAVASLGPALQQAIAAQRAGRSAESMPGIDRVPPPLNVPAGIDAASLRNLLARHLARAISNRLPADHP